jgi:hypothetical protein
MPHSNSTPDVESVTRSLVLATRWLALVDLFLALVTLSALLHDLGIF